MSNYAISNKPDLIFITETWANPDFPDGFYSLPGYNLVRADRMDKRGGGVMIYAHSTVTSSVVSLANFESFECSCLKIPLRNGMHFGLLCVYRPPSITSIGDSQLINVIETFLSFRYDLNVIIGDFNMPSINWNTLSAPPKCSPFLKIFTNYFLKQHVTEPTRPNSNAILDLIFTSNGTNVYDISVEECFGTSDHSIINFKIQLPCSTTSRLETPKRNFSKANWVLFRNLLQETDWNYIFDQENINEVWKEFKTALTNSLQASIPYKKRKPWQIKSNSKIRTALRYTRRCHLDYKTIQNNETLLKFIHAKMSLQELIEKQTASFEQYIVSSFRKNPKVYWSYVNNKLRRKQDSLTSIKVGNRTVEDPAEIAETLNDYFYNNFNRHVSDLTTTCTESATSSALNDIVINFDIVCRTIKSLPEKSSEDHEGFSYAVLKNGGNVLAHQITRLFKLSFINGQVPMEWKKSVIFPIKKKASTKTIDSFRPISITSCFCRAFERIVRNSIMKFITDNSFMNKSQHGFVCGRSTTSALLSYANDISFALDKGLCIDSAYFDFSKAFDNVRHDYLIQKLIKCGICGGLLRWIIDYLTNRTQVVKIKNCLSSEKQVTSGVIQGSVLGPLFFSIFVNDIDDIVKNCVLLKYADDIRIYRCFRPDIISQTVHSNLFQSDIDALSAWSDLWDLKFNVAKCCILHFGRSNAKATYKMNNLVLKRKYQERDLGILFSTNFKFDDHIHLITKKANRQLGIIAKVFSSRTPQIIVPLFKTFVRPHLEYNSIIWSPYTKNNDKLIEKIQKRMCNILYGARSSNYQEKLKKAGLLSLRARRIRDQLINVYKLKNKMIDLDFEDFFLKSKCKKTRGNAFKLMIPKSKTKIRHHFFTCSIIKHWNRLKSSDINVRSIRLFKKNIIKYLRRENIW